MKNLFLLLFIIISFIGCKSQADYAKEQHIRDSIYQIQKEKMFADAAARQRAQDSMFRAHDSIEMLKRIEGIKKDKKAYNIYKKHPEFGIEACYYLAKNQIWIGMSLDMLKYSRGNPNHVNVSNYGNGNEYQWCWEDYTPSCFYGKSDGIITSYN